VGSAYTDAFTGNVAKLSKAAKFNLGFNDSSLHWDLVNTENKTVTAILKNGKKRIIYRNGEFSL
jgi:aminopeptidase